MRPPEHFESALRAYDPRLRCRWGARTKVWIIERKMAERSPSLMGEKPSPYKSPRGLDLWDGWKDGYVHVMNVHPELLSWSVVEEALTKADIERQGSWERLSKQIDAEQEEEDKAADRITHNWSEAAASDAFDRLQWLLGNRIATPFAEPATPLVTTYEQDGYVVHDRRVRA